MATQPPPDPRPKPTPAPRPKVDCEKVKHTCDAFYMSDNPVMRPLAAFIWGATGCAKVTGTNPYPL